MTRKSRKYIENQQKIIEEFLNHRPDLTLSRLMKMPMLAAVPFHAVFPY